MKTFGGALQQIHHFAASKVFGVVEKPPTPVLRIRLSVAPSFPTSLHPYLDRKLHSII